MGLCSRNLRQLQIYSEEVPILRTLSFKKKKAESSREPSLRHLSHTRHHHAGVRYGPTSHNALRHGITTKSGRELHASCELNGEQMPPISVPVHTCIWHLGLWPRIVQNHKFGPTFGFFRE